MIDGAARRMGVLVEATDETFDREVLGSSQPVLVDFWSPECKPCRLVAPGLAEVAQRFSGRVKFVRVNADRSRRTAARYRVRSLPTVMIIHRGAVRESATGVRPSASYERLLERVLAS